MSGFAWVTLATNDSYSLGALVLAHSLKQVGTAHQLVVLVTPGVTNVMRKNLADVFNVVEEVNLFDSKDEANLRLLKRPELGVTFTKLHCWRLTQFEKCVFLDADVLVLANSDELFEREEFSAAPDVGWPDCFNSGVFVYRPSLETYSKLVDFALQKGSFDGGDQGLLNAYFSDWAHKDISKHLPFIYNMCSTASYSYMPAFKYYGANVKIVHFIGPAKPWLQYFDTESRKVHPSPDLQHLQDVLQKWWDLFCSLIHPKLSPDMAPSKQSAEYPPHIPSHSYSNQNIPVVHHEELTITDAQNRTNTETNTYNVWDPWEEYEERESRTLSTNHDNKDYVIFDTTSQVDVPETSYCDNTNNISYTNLVNTHESGIEKHVPYIRENNSEQNISLPLPSVHNNSFNRPVEKSPFHNNGFNRPVEKSPFHNNSFNRAVEKSPFHNNSFNRPVEKSPIHINNFNRPVEKSPVLADNRGISNVHQQILSNDQHKEDYNQANHNASIFESRLDILNKNFDEIHKDSDDNDFNSILDSHKPPENLNPTIPFTPPAQVHSLTEISLPNMREISPNISQDASLHTKDYDDADNKSQSGLAGAFAQFTLGVKRSPSQDALENHLRRQAWEVGNIDYMGRDSFDNIWNKICQTLSSTQLRDGAVSSTDTQQTPEIAKDIKTDVQQPEETAPQEQQTILEAAVPEIPQTQEVPASVPEVGDKPQEEVAVIQETVTQKDEIEPKAIEPTVEIPKPDDKPQVTPAVSEVKSEATEILKVDEKLTEPIPQQDVPQEVIAPKEEPAEPVLQQDVAQEVKSEIPTETAEVPKPSETVTEKLVEPTPKLEETAAEKIEDKPSETVAQKVEESTIPKVEDKPSEPETQKAEEAPKVEDIPSEIVAQKVEEIVTLKPEDQASEIVAEKAEEKPSEIVAQKTEQTQVPKEEEKPSETVAQTVQETEIPKTVEQPSETVAQIVQETEIPKTVEQASETVAQILQETEIPKTVEQPSETVAQIMQETEVPKAVEQPSEQLDQPIASLEKESITTTKDEPKLKEIKPELTATAEVPAQEVIVEKIKPKVKKVPTSPAKVVDKPSVELKQPQKEKAAPASPPTPTSPVARETPKEIPPPQKEKVKSESPVDVPKVQAKPEKALESPKPDESSKTEVTAQAETSAEASAEVPKSDTKPKETRKVKKKVKKVVKAADPATAESSQTPEGASKK